MTVAVATRPSIPAASGSPRGNGPWAGARGQHDRATSSGADFVAGPAVAAAAAAAAACVMRDRERARGRTGRGTREALRQRACQSVTLCV